MWFDISAAMQTRAKLPASSVPREEKQQDGACVRLGFHQEPVYSTCYRRGSSADSEFKTELHGSAVPPQKENCPTSGRLKRSGDV